MCIVLARDASLEKFLIPYYRGLGVASGGYWSFLQNRSKDLPNILHDGSG